MATEKAPAFQFYVKDFIDGTVDLSAEDVGAYMRLLCYQWGKGVVPADLTARARIAGLTRGRMQAVWGHIQRHFDPIDGGDFRNPRLERERQKQDAYRQRQAVAGKASAEARFNRGSTGVQPPFQPEGNSASAICNLHSSEVRTRANGHRQHAFCGSHFCVSQRQHDVLSKELGSARERVDLLALYPVWDESDDPIDNLLPWLKVRIQRETDRLFAERIEQAREDWYEECGRLHNHECGLSSDTHRTRMLLEAEKAASA